MESSQISESDRDSNPIRDSNPGKELPWQPREPFRARRWLRGGHVQTLASFLAPRRIHLAPAEERLVEVAPGVKVRCWCRWRSPDHGNRLTLIVVHGLEGSSESQYMLGVARNGLAAGMNVVLMNQRNCGGMDHFAPTLYNSSLSADVAAVARHLVEHEGASHFALAGFSMGGNLALKLAGEWAKNAPPEFRAVAAVCPAMDLAASADALHEPANRLYEWYFLVQLFRRMRKKVRFFPNDFDVSRLRGVSSLRLFDDRVTAHYCGFTGADDYYARAAAANVVGQIAVPALIIHANNDPFIRIQPQTRERILANPHITFIETDDGGHCAFIGDPDGDGYDGHWAEREVVEFLRRFA
ncbi:MAG: alpha/beta fold hydrolase [Candidatus Sulfotelmatobacter sp.]